MSEGVGAILAGWRNVVGIELDGDYCAMGEARLAWWQAAMQTTGLTEPKAILTAMGKRKAKEPEAEMLPLFEGIDNHDTP